MKSHKKYLSLYFASLSTYIINSHVSLQVLAFQTYNGKKWPELIALLHCRIVVLRPW